MAACPECGFELPRYEACSVCGYRPKALSVAAPGADPEPEKEKSKPRGIGVFSLSLASAFFVFSFVLYTLYPAPQEPVTQEAPPVGKTAPAAEPFPAPPKQDLPREAAKPVVSAPAFDITKRTELPPVGSEQEYLRWMLRHTKETEVYLKAKWLRSREILQRKDITEDRVLQAFLMAPREFFCRSYNMKRAYDDAAMPIGHGQTISGPHMVSRMTQSLGLETGHRVLEIGTGSGYQASVLAELSNFVFTIEIVAELTRETDAIYEKLEKDYPQYKNIRRRNSDGYYGWEEYAPFDRIIVTCGIDHIPPPLLRQLAPGGIMVIPVGPPSGQTVMKVTKKMNPDGSTTLEREDIFHGRKVIFVPFTAEKGGVHSLENERKKGTP